jgi:hypothetical protein
VVTRPSDGRKTYVCLTRVLRTILPVVLPGAQPFYCLNQVVTHGQQPVQPTREYTWCIHSLPYNRSNTQRHRRVVEGRDRPGSSDAYCTAPGTAPAATFSGRRSPNPFLAPSLGILPRSNTCARAEEI